MSCLYAKVLHHVGDGGDAWYLIGSRLEAFESSGPWPAASRQSWSFQFLKHLLPVSSRNLNEAKGSEARSPKSLNYSAFFSAWGTA